MTKEKYIQSVGTMRTRIVAWAERALGSADEAEDVAQEVMLRLWMMHERLSDDGDATRLAKVMTRNLCANHLRDNSRHSMLSIEHARGIATEEADRPVIEAENERRLRKAAANIPDRYRTILYMRNTEGLAYRDIAAALGTTESSVRGMVSKARAALIQQLKLREQ